MGGADAAEIALNGHEAQCGSNPRGWAGLAVFLIVLVINISMWVISLKNLKRGYHKAQHDPEDKKQDVLLDRRYIIPLVFAFGWLVGDWVLPGVALLLQERVSS